jgi:hypothetical protein
MATQVFETLSSRKAMLILLEHDLLDSYDLQALETMDWL